MHKHLLFFLGIGKVISPTVVIEKKGIEARCSHINKQGCEPHDHPRNYGYTILNINCIEGCTGKSAHADNLRSHLYNIKELAFCHKEIILFLWDIFHASSLYLLILIQTYLYSAFAY